MFTSLPSSESFSKTLELFPFRHLKFDLRLAELCWIAVCLKNSFVVDLQCHQVRHDEPSEKNPRDQKMQFTMQHREGVALIYGTKNSSLRRQN